MSQKAKQNITIISIVIALLLALIIVLCFTLVHKDTTLNQTKEKDINNIASGDENTTYTYTDSSGIWTWYINDGTTTATIKKYNSSLPSVTIPSSIEKDGVTYIVNTLYSASDSNKGVFYNKKYMTSVTIPDSITNIGDYAFYNCTSLTSVTIPDSVTSIGSGAFSGCTGLTGVTIPDSVTSIGSGAFSGCTNITNYTTYNNAKYLGNSNNPYLVCWQYASQSITSVTIHPNTRFIHASAFYRCTSLTSIIIPDGVTNIGKNAFQNCTGLISVTIGKGVASIGYSAFTDCSGLTAVYYQGTIAQWCNISFDGSFTNSSSNPLCYAHNLYIDNTLVTSGNLVIPDTVTEIKQYAFYNCTGLTSVTIGNNVTSIGQGSFSNCTGLTSVTIGNNVTSIGQGSFSNCTGLTSVYYQGTIAQWCNISFDGYLLYNAYNLYIDNTLVTDLVIPDTVTEIKDYAFRDCTCLTNVTIPDSVTSIGYSAFTCCSSLTSVTIGNGVASIGDSVFSSCTGLTSVIIPDSVTSIGDYAFSSCTGLTSITISDSVMRIGQYAFSGCTGLTAVYYQGTIAQWCNINFSDFWSNPLYNANKHNLYIDGTLVTDLVIPDTVTKIKQYAFLICTTLTSVIIPDSVTSIDSSAFYGCTGLTSVTIPSSVTIIGSSTFKGCTNLTSVTFLHDYSSGVQTSSQYSPNYIGSYAFTSGNSDVIYYFINQTSRDKAYNINNRSNYFTSSNFQVLSPQFNVSVNNSEWGSITGNTAPELNSNTTLTAVPNSGYALKHWLKNGNIYDTNTSIAVTYTEYVTYTAVFDVEYTITAISQDITNGSVAGGGAYVNGRKVALTATPVHGYKFSKWLKNGENFTSNTTNPITITVTGNDTYTAVFVKDSFTITASVESSNSGTVTGAGTYEYLTEVTLTATNNYGYVFVKWQKDNQDFENNNISSIQVTVTDNATYKAVLRKEIYTITTNSANLTMGTASGGNSYEYLDSVNLTATRNIGYQFVKWLKNNEDFTGNTANPITTTVTGNDTYTAVFEVKNCTILTTENLTPTVGSVNNIAGEYQEGTQLNLTATPNTGAKFFYWLKNGQTFAGSLSNPLTITVTEDAAYTVCFAPADYNPEISSPNSVILETEYQGTETTDPEVCGMVKTYGYGSLDGVQTVRLEAIATSGYRFVGWKINGESTVSSKYTSNKADILLTDIPNSKIIIAVFDKAT